MAAEISSDYAGRELLALIALRGSFIFAADLLRRMTPDLVVRIDFMSLGSYHNATVSSGKIEVVKDLEVSLQGTDVLIIDDILDTGRTLHYIRDLAKSRGAASIRTATLLLKDRPRENPSLPDYIGFQIPDVFVVGYGLDYAQRYRNLPHIRVLEVEQSR
jgi:hypoxanthine phosphoribosyltransferase